MEGFLIHVEEGQSSKVRRQLARIGKVVPLSSTLCAVRTEVPAQALLDKLTASMPEDAQVLIARTNGAYFQGDQDMSAAAKLLG